MSDKRLGTIQDKCQVFANGSLLLKTATKSDTGNYTVELYDHFGHFISKTEIEVIIMEPVSQPEIHASCMVDGQVMLTCSVDRGDEVKLQWTRLGNLSQQLQSERTLYLVSNAFVHMACVAENPVSKKSSKPITKKCRDAEENIYIAMQGCQEWTTRAQEKEATEMDNSLYVTCKSLCPSPHSGTTKVTE
ncbi:hypothetical protein AAFF_G00319350 [Aldrovandia affinis]|uniref:Ig-like domain-containing protein n=1 Tax=Aldrovandia affinis TaxID=143900 RepID=A0AAD7WQE6_9TELE|nr:hypothetical protein AAFF_G00319350 [Aldrovandia affinis]